MKSLLPKLLILFLSVGVFKISIAQMPDLIPYRKGNLWGYVDSNKVIKVKPTFASVEGFDELGRARVKHYVYETFEKRKIEDRFIDKQGRLIPKGYNIFGNKLYYGIHNDSIWIIDKISNNRVGYPFLLKYQKNNINHRTLAFRVGKKIQVVKDNGEQYSFRVPRRYYFARVDFIKRVVEEQTLFYTLKKDTTLQILGVGEGLIYVAKNGKEYLKLYNKNKVQEIKGVFRLASLINNCFILNTGREKQVFNRQGKKLFSLKTKNSLGPFGKKFFAEYQYIEGYKNGTASIINTKGEYVKKGIPLTEEGSYKGIYKGLFYRINNSCFLVQDTIGNTDTICTGSGYARMLRMNKNFLVLKTSDSTINLYNSSWKLLLENWSDAVCRYGERETKYHVIGEKYFPITVNGQNAIIDRNGKITVIKIDCSSGLIAVGKFFLTANMGGVTLIDSNGSPIKHYNFIDNTPMGTYPQHFFVTSLQSILARNNLKEIVITLEDRILIIKDNTYTEMDAAYCRKKIGKTFNGFYMDVSPWLGRIRLIKGNNEINNNYCFIDKYGTVYYDE